MNHDHPRKVVNEIAVLLRLWALVVVEIAILFRFWAPVVIEIAISSRFWAPVLIIGILPKFLVEAMVCAVVYL